jgi:hypothetical protein
MNIRKADENDKSEIARLIDTDEFHKGKGTADFFFEPGTECMAVESGDHKFYVRIARSLRINAIFDPTDARGNAVLLKQFTEWIAQSASGAGFRELVFSTDSEPLAEFEKKLGFQESPKDLIMALPFPERLA